MRCKGICADGSPCRVPEQFVGPDGWCHAHGPGAEKRMAERGRKGAEATARRLRRSGLDEADLPALDSPQAAERWLEEIGRAVATGRLGHHEGSSVVRAVREWLRAHEAGELSEELDELRARVASLKGRGLEVVP